MSFNKTMLKLGALALPFAALLFMAGNAALNRDAGQSVWQVKIAGYDPRDLLYGHYLTYRYEWNIKGDGAALPENDTCLCLTASGSGHRDPDAMPMHCPEKKTARCDAVIQAWNSHGSYSLKRGSNPEQYFIPENRARELESLLREGKQTLRIEFAAHRDGHTAIRTLYIGEQPLAAYLNLPPPAQREGG